MINILVTGANGQLGRCFAELALEYPQYNWHLASRTELDITDAQACLTALQQSQAHYCLNTAAYTAVDKAESEPEQANAINALGPARLAAACAQTGTHLIHFSTDYVYSDQYNRPLREDDLTEPKGVYAATKLAGEHQVMQQLPTATIIRTSWVYARHGHNFLNTMLRLGRERDQLNVVFDQIGSPTLADDLARACLYLIEAASSGQIDAHQLQGVFHYSHEGVCSWYDFAQAIFELSGIQCLVNPIESHQYPTPAHRPHYSVLNKEKIKTTFNLPIPHWREGLKKALSQNSAS